MAVVIVTVTSEPLIMGTMIAEEQLPLGGAVEPRGLGDLRGHALDGGRQDDHREAGLQPDEDDDQRERVDVEVGRLDPRAPAPARSAVQMAFSRPYCGWPAGRQA